MEAQLVPGAAAKQAHWRAASVSVDVPFDTSSAEITITNQFGESTTAATGC